MAEETKDDVLDVEDTEDTSVNWEARFTKLKERQRSAKTTYESRIAELEGKLKEPVKELKETKSEVGKLEKVFLRVAGITDPDEIELVRKWQKDTGKDIDELIDHPFVKAELEQIRQSKANKLATANIKSDTKDGAKDDVDHWLSKGELPQGAENKKLRQKILVEKLRREKDGSAGGKFYNS